jgi:hypothetical protein
MKANGSLLNFLILKLELNGLELKDSKYLRENLKEDNIELLIINLEFQDLLPGMKFVLYNKFQKPLIFRPQS